MNENDSDNSTVWPPESKICYITHELISIIAHTTDFDDVQALDLHLRDGSLGKIKQIENLNLLTNLRQLNLSYNAITNITNIHMLKNLVELNLAENNIRNVINFCIERFE